MTADSRKTRKRGLPLVGGPASLQFVGDADGVGQSAHDGDGERRMDLEEGDE